MHALRKARANGAEVNARSLVAERVTGLVIMGKEGEPHPVFVFRRFLAMVEAGELDPAVAASADEIIAMMKKWEEGMSPNGEASNDGLKLDFDEDR